MGFVFGTTKNESVPGLIGISSMVVVDSTKYKSKVGQQFTVMMIKDYEETIETSLDLEIQEEREGPEFNDDIITEIQFTHNRKYITSVEIKTSGGQ